MHRKEETSLVQELMLKTQLLFPAVRDLLNPIMIQPTVEKAIPTT